MVPITVAVPTHNRARFLPRAVRSILRQSFERFELLILDNASEDRDWERLPEFADPRIRIIRHPVNIGLVNNQNFGIREAAGEAICLFHDDDLMEPRFLESMVRFLEASPSAGLVFSLARRVDCVGHDLGVYWRPSGSCRAPDNGLIRGEDYILWNLRHAGHVTLPPGVVITKAAYARVGVLSQDVSHTAFDINMFLRVAMQFDVGLVPEVLVQYTLHPMQVSNELWRTNDQLDGQIDVDLEMLAAASWLLARPTLADRTRREVAQIIRRSAANVRRYADKRSLRRRTL